MTDRRLATAGRTLQAESRRSPANGVERLRNLMPACPGGVSQVHASARAGGRVKAGSESGVVTFRIRCRPLPAGASGCTRTVVMRAMTFNGFPWALALFEPKTLHFVWVLPCVEGSTCPLRTRAVSV